MEVPPCHSSVADGVGAQLGDDEDDGFVRVGAVRDTPHVQPVSAQVPREAGTARSGTEAHREPVHRQG
ncbi:hypothetical protein GCM10010499_35420 [Streptomyces thermoviolaceus subsp. apingens]|nr:hypothetical protein GCM10010499_35420 [Streptomyces thermoviolaceus subsp. apingens]